MDSVGGMSAGAGAVWVGGGPAADCSSCCRPRCSTSLHCLQVLHQFVRGSELEEERLAYFSLPEGRDDLYEYNQREGAAVRPATHGAAAAWMP